MFQNREEAGEKLAERLKEEDVEADIVLAIPRGGLPAGRKVADVLDVPLDVVVAKKIGAPGNPELAIGAVSSDGSHWLNEELIERQSIGEGYIEDKIQEESQNAEEKLSFMRENRDQLKLRDKKILLVDDGLATGATMIACLKQVNKHQPSKITLAVSIAPKNLKEELEDLSDEIYVLENFQKFGSVGMYYRDFEQLSNEEARSYLD